MAEPSQQISNPFASLIKSTADPFALNFLFAMGELTGQVKALSDSVRGLEARLKGQDDEIESLKKWRWIVVGGASVASAMLATVTEWVIQHGWH